jgi:hypothetical protein
MTCALNIVIQIDAEIIERVVHGDQHGSSEAVYNLRLKMCRERGLHHVQTTRYPEPVEWLRSLSRYDNSYTYQGDDYWFSDQNLAFEFKMLFG